MPTTLEQNRLEMGGTLHNVNSLGVEPTVPGFPYSVEPFEILGELNEVLDAAKIIIEPNGYTPPQQLIRTREALLGQDYLLDFPLRGNGTLLLFRDGQIEYHHFDEENPDQKDMSIVYSAGTYLCWKAGSKGLTLIEACSPPFQMGDAKTVDLNEGSTPREFREAFLKFTEQVN